MKYTVSGPLFDGRFGHIVDDMIEDMQHEVAQQAFADVHQNADRSFKHPTPYYETQITQERQGAEEVVHDRGLVYGPWLEDGGSRSDIFPGYHIWRRAAESTRRKMQPILNHVLSRYISKLNGGS